MAVWLLALAIALTSACASTPTQQPPVAVKIVAINDFHGNLDVPPEGLSLDDSEVPAGGVTHLATLIESIRAQNPHFAFVSAGDLVGASPLLSATFDDEPTIEAMNAMALDFSAVGNHEFDRGLPYLVRLQQGGCPAGGCKSGKPFAGAHFPYLSANIFEHASGKRVFPPYVVKEYGSVKVAFIGVTLRNIAAVVIATNIAGLDFADEADSVNALIPELRSQGIETIVVVVHEGGYTAGSYNECTNLRGPIVDIAQRLDAAVDVVISAHTHRAYVCTVHGKLLTSAGSYGLLFTEIDLGIDPASRNVVSSRAVNRVVAVDVQADRAQAAIVDSYRALAPALKRAVGRITEPFSRRPNRDGESRMGRFIADAHLAATTDAGATIAFIQPGGIRAPFPYRDAGEVTYEDVFAVYPFSNSLVTMTLTGDQILQLLEQQWQGMQPQVLQVSSGFRYGWSADRPPGERVLRESVLVNGKRLQSAERYRVTVNSFLAQGGDGFKVLLEGTDRVERGLARDAILAYLAQHSPLMLSTERRVRRMP